MSTAESVYRERILRDGENIEELFVRVASCVSGVEATARKRKYWFDRFFNLLNQGKFLPNSPTLVNAGSGGQLSACFVLPISGGLDGIFDSLKNAAKIHQSGGGTGFDFSPLKGPSSLGPIEAMKLFDGATEVIKQGGVRRGANMGILRCDHPEIKNFISCKRSQGFRNFNISIGITGEFLNAVRNLASWSLTDGTVVNPKDLWNDILNSAWETGDPGLIFLDRLELFNPTPTVGELRCTNPCGEQPLLDFESCNLGSINLSKYWDAKRGYLKNELIEDAKIAVRFLDNVIDANVFPIEEAKRVTLKNRKVGLGVMGFADFLIKAGARYGSVQSCRWADQVMGDVACAAREASVIIGLEKGSFSGFGRSMWKKLGLKALRNATLTTVAPTGTISILAECSSGIEPHFSARLRRRILDGAEFIANAPILDQIWIQKGLAREVVSHKRAQEVVGSAWVVAHEVPIDQSLKIQSIFQKHSDSAVSKTINLPQSATTADIDRAYFMAYELGCKGITVYRDQSKELQVLGDAQNEVQCEVCWSG